MALCSVFALLLFLTGCATTPDYNDIRQAAAHVKLGNSYLNEGQLSEAFVEFQKAVRLDPGNKESYNYLGFISARYKKYDEAIKYYKEAISIDPDYSEALNNLGVVYVETGDWDEAIKCFKAALKNPVYRTPAWAYSNMGYAYYKKGDYKNAEKAVKEALIRNPIFPSALYILGLVYVKLNDDEAAIEAFKKAIGIAPGYVEAHWELANIYMRRGEKAKALKHFNIVAEQDQNTPRGREARKLIESLKY